MLDASLDWGKDVLRNAVPFKPPIYPIILTAVRRIRARNAVVIGCFRFAW
jgi:hypothetical protein